MKIIVCSNTTWSLYNFRRGLLSKLVSLGHELHILAPYDQRFSPLLLSMGCKMHDIYIDSKGKSVLKDAFLSIRLYRSIRSQRPDIFLTFTIKPNIYGGVVAAITNTTVISNIEGLGTAFIGSNYIKNIVIAMYKVSLSRSKAVIFINPSDRELFLKNRMVKEKQARTLPGAGVDLEYFKPQGNNSSLDEFRFLFIGRILFDKGVGEYVKAARLVRKKYPGVEFHILGFLGVENQSAVPKKLIDEWCGEGVVKYLGASGDVRGAIAGSDCVVLPSYREGLPRSLLEGSAMAKPLIASNVPGCRDVVEEGVTGLLCSPRDENDLAAKMLELLAMPKEKRVAMGREGRAKMEREFSEKDVSEQYINIISECANSNCWKN